jgi:hypothetical protein
VAGFSANGNGRANFHQLVAARAGDSRDTYHGEEFERRARTTIRAATRAPVDVAVVSSPRKVTILARPGTPIRPRIALNVDTLITAVARYMRVSREELLAVDRRVHIVAARRVALIAWRILLGRRVVEIAAALGLSHSAASQLLAREEPVALLRPAAEAVLDEIRRCCRPNKVAAEVLEIEE